MCRDSAEGLFPEGARERGESGEIGVRDVTTERTKVEQIRRSRILYSARKPRGDRLEPVLVMETGENSFRNDSMSSRKSLARRS